MSSLVREQRVAAVYFTTWRRPKSLPPTGPNFGMLILTVSVLPASVTVTVTMTKVVTPGPAGIATDVQAASVELYSKEWAVSAKDRSRRD